MGTDFLSNSAEVDLYGVGGINEFMTEDDALKLADALSVVNAACCIVGVAPSLASYFHGPEQFVLDANDSNTNQRLPETQARIVAMAICTAITTGKLKAAHIERPNVHGISESLLDIWDTLIDIDELKRWLLSRNSKPPFFFGANASNTPVYLEAKHPNYSPEIAAAIKVWKAIQDPELRKGKTAKAAAIDWLETNYRELGLMHQGKRSNAAIERIALVVNWETSGGAPKTPG
jgi:hypothetical protein